MFLWISILETTSIKNNMVIIGNDMRINKNNGSYFWKVWEEIIRAY